MGECVSYGPDIERAGLWGDFHHLFVAALREHLSGILPSRYLTTIDERVYVAWEEPPPDPVTEPFLKVRAADGQLVAVVELLSPNNKKPGHEGREAYLRKRRRVLRSAAHLVEMDLLVAGARMPLVEPWPEGDYHVLVARGDRRPAAEVYSWRAGEALPTIAFPLLEPDPDVPVRLQDIFQRTWERGTYDRLLERLRPLE